MIKESNTGQFSFSKGERLKNKKIIDHVFKTGKKISLFPFDFRYLKKENDSINEVLISVSKSMSRALKCGVAALAILEAKISFLFALKLREAPNMFKFFLISFITKLIYLVHFLQIQCQNVNYN